MRICFLALGLIAALHAEGRTRAVSHPTVIPTPASVMWIGAHPDDEVVAGPLLAKWCREAGARCAFLVLTRGEAGPCLRPEGCLPDIATVRSAEAAAAAQYFGATSILLTLPDGGGSAPPNWEPRREVVAAIANYIEAFRPMAILTFDPRHGTTCHPDHRATGDLVLEAVTRLPYVPAVYLLETTTNLSSFRSAFASAQRFDANQILQSTGEPAWNAAIDVMRLHPSQFDATGIRAMENVPRAERAVFIAPAATALVQTVDECR